MMLQATRYRNNSLKGRDMKFFITVATLFLSTLCFAQTPIWQWAARGGGVNNSNANNPSLTSEFERVVDIAVDNNNNYYFVSQINSGNVTLQSITPPVFSRSATGNTDILVHSTSCDGTLRWSKVLGADFKDYVTSIKTDQNNNVYVSGYTTPKVSNGNTRVHFDTDSIAPATYGINNPGIHNKTLFLIKYNDQGVFQWLRQPQKDQSLFGYTFSGQIHTEANGTSHWLVAMLSGSHVNGSVVVNTTSPRGDWMVLRYDANGNYLTNTNIPDFSGSVSNPSYTMNFAYNETLQRYYVSAHKRPGGSSDTIFYDGVQIANTMFLACIDFQGTTLWTKNDSGGGGNIAGLLTDPVGNVYLAGRHGHGVDPTASFEGFSFGQSNPTGGRVDSRNYVMKLNPQGNLIWGSDPSFNQVSRNGAYQMVLNGNELAVTAALNPNTWDGINFTYGNGNNMNAPVVLRFNKDTGSLLGISEAGMDLGSTQAAISIDVDSFGNYIVGGYMTGNLFNNDPIVPMIQKQGGAADLWYAKLARTDCAGAPLSTQEVTSRNIKIYPNPTSDFVYIQSDAPVTSYKIMNLAGQLLLQETVNAGQAIDVTGLAVGVYFIRVEGMRGVEVLRFVRM